MFSHRKSLDAAESSYTLFLREWTQRKYVFGSSFRKNAGFKWLLSYAVGTFIYEFLWKFYQFFQPTVLSSFKSFFQYWRIIFLLSSYVCKCFLLCVTVLLWETKTARVSADVVSIWGRIYSCFIFSKCFILSLE